MGLLGIVQLGDSQTECGGANSAGVDDATNTFIKAMNSSNAIVTATETILNTANKGMNPGQVGDTLATVRDYLLPQGQVPANYSGVAIIGTSWAGTSFNSAGGQWSVTGARAALDGTGNFYDRVNTFLSLDPSNRIWYFDWFFGTNCAGENFQSEGLALFNEIRANVRTAAAAPVLLTGIPVDDYDPDLGGSTGLTSVLSDIASVESWLPNSRRVDVSGLRSYLHNTFKHFSATSHRGRIADNSDITNVSRASGVYTWSAGDNTAGNYNNSGVWVIDPSDNFIYKQTGASGATQPSLDGGVNWKKTIYQYGLMQANPLSKRKAALVAAASRRYEGAW